MTYCEGALELKTEFWISSGYRLAQSKISTLPNFAIDQTYQVSPFNHDNILKFITYCFAATMTLFNLV